MVFAEVVSFEIIYCYVSHWEQNVLIAEIDLVANPSVRPQLLIKLLKSIKH